LFVMFSFPQFMMIRIDSQHLRPALRATFLLAGHTSLMGNFCFTFGADALTCWSHFMSSFHVKYLFSLS
jgi:hypothetical protein